MRRVGNGVLDVAKNDNTTFHQRLFETVTGDEEYTFTRAVGMLTCAIVGTITVPGEDRAGFIKVLNDQLLNQLCDQT